MRTTRIGSIGGNVYGHTKRCLKRDEAFTLMNDGRSLDDFNRQQRQKRDRKKKVPAQKRVLVNKRQHILIKGIQFEGDMAAVVRNRLLRQSLQVNYISNLKRRNDTYRTSI
ncbi:MAG: hypothetical protein ACI33P_00025 [Lysinibacillus sp.]